jgi:hypothetical protein
MNRRGVRILAAFVFAAVVLTALPAFATKVGVGVNLGKIDITEKVVPGGVYKLPGIGVVNTGETAMDYQVVAVGMYKPADKQPDPSWFEFVPKTFTLQPGAVQQVYGRMTVPIGAEPGNYFEFLQAHPVVKASGISLGVAAATKLSFVVSPSNWFAALWYRVRDLTELYSPWSYIAYGVVVFLAIAIPVQRRYRFSFGVARRAAAPSSED